jgi:leucyl aminopeptidase
MKTIFFTDTILEYVCDVLVIARGEDDDISSLEQTVDKILHQSLSAKVIQEKFSAKSGQSVLIDTLGLVKSKQVLLIGLGKRAQWKGRSVRDTAAEVARKVIAVRASSVTIAVELDDLAIHEWQLGFQLGLYQFNDFKKESKDKPWHKVESLVFAVSQVQHTGLVTRANTLANAVNLARTLVNEPANVCTPERLAQVARDMSTFDHVKVTVFEKAEIEAKKMGGVIAVSQGASRDPKFIHVHYSPENAQGTLALIGKGLTFDSGGLSLKPPKSQEMMHIDMGGAAAVLGAMHALVRLQPQVELHAIVGACENMPDGNSYRPSDILTMYNKKTVEVLNTDAEGRLVLADALHYAAQLKPDAMVNLATLTGACMVGLGSNYCGIFSDDDEWAQQLLNAGEGAGEKLWRLPLDEGLADSLKSKRADISNLGGPWGGAITAALFLKSFKGDRRWAHMDIAGPTTASKNKGSVPEGGTGFGVLTLIQLAENFTGS